MTATVPGVQLKPNVKTMQTELYFGTGKNERDVYVQFIRVNCTVVNSVVFEKYNMNIAFEPLDEAEFADFLKVCNDSQQREFLFKFANQVSPEILEAINKGRKVLYFSDPQLNTIFELIK